MERRWSPWTPHSCSGELWNEQWRFICVCSLLEDAGITPSCERPYKVTVNKSNSYLGKDFSKPLMSSLPVSQIQLPTFPKGYKTWTFYCLCSSFVRNTLKLFSGLTAPIRRLEVQIKPKFLIMSSSDKSSGCFTHLLFKYAAYEGQPIRITALRGRSWHVLFHMNWSPVWAKVGLFWTQNHAKPSIKPQSWKSAGQLWNIISRVI